jgi:hypothetical protein
MEAGQNLVNVVKEAETNALLRMQVGRSLRQQGILSCLCLLFQLRLKGGMGKPICYAIAKGRAVGIVHTYTRYQELCKNFSGCNFKGHESVKEAEAWLEKSQIVRPYQVHDFDTTGVGKVLVGAEHISRLGHHCIEHTVTSSQTFGSPPATPVSGSSNDHSAILNSINVGIHSTPSAGSVATVLGKRSTNNDEGTVVISGYPGPELWSPSKSSQPWNTQAAQWVYEDTQQTVQGPFSGTTMNEWVQKQYFPGNLMCKIISWVQFARLDQIYPSPESAFMITATEPTLQLVPMEHSAQSSLQRSTNLTGHHEDPRAHA